MPQNKTMGNRPFRGLSAAAAIVILIALASPGYSAGPSKGGGTAGGSRWVRIDYDDLIDRSVLTHGDRTVGDLLKASRKGAGLPKNVLSNLQPHLEPFSFVCNEIVTATGPPGEKPYANILDDYPPGSRQPAWAALFREGRYQLFFAGDRARLFLKGENPAKLFRRNRGVVRHPLQKILEKSAGGRIRLEVYAFRNDYASRTVSLDLKAYVAEITPRDCAPETREFPLEEVAEFFAQGPVLEAAEIEEGGDFSLYGSRGGRPTVGGEPLSIEDFAVVYRAVFHHGNNPPYVSLDRAEDNRYAKVNFGGQLQDTHVGNVLLESDKLFKTIVTGLDPDRRTPIAEKIKTAVPDFRTVDERTLFAGKEEWVKVRFWFYPDRIRTVTDGRIGVVESYRFTADLERVDGKARSYPEGREGIDHLNRKFASYAGVLPPFGELQTVGRMMAIVKWLRETDARRRVDLDALLSVELPPFRTPLRTRKIVAATDGIRISHGTSFEEIHKASSLDNILEECSATTEDPAIAEKALDRAKSFGIETILPGGRQVCPAAVGRSTSISVNGGVDMNPAGLSPPRRSPDSPLIARIRNARLSESKSSADGGTGLIRSKLHRSPSPPVKARKPSGSRKNEPPAAKTPPAGKPLAVEPASRPLAREVVVKTRAYPSEIVVTPSQSAGGTIVLRKGRPIVGN